MGAQGGGGGGGVVVAAFLDDDGGNYTFLDTAAAGPPMRAFWLGGGEPEVVAASLDAWLEDYVGAVEAGLYHQEPERGTFLRRKSGR